VLNLHALNPSANSVITAFPAGIPRPTTVNLRPAKGQPDDGLITIAPGKGGDIAIYNKAGKTDLAADVIGYYGSLRGGLRYGTTYPTQVCPADDPGEMLTTIAPHTAVVFKVGGYADIPATGASAAALQVEEEQSSAAGSITVYPTGSTRPSLSD